MTRPPHARVTASGRPNHATRWRHWVGTVISLGGEAAVQVVPPPDCDPLSALLRSAAVQASSDGQTECQLVKANREQACQPV